MHEMRGAGQVEGLDAGKPGQQHSRRSANVGTLSVPATKAACTSLWVRGAPTPPRERVDGRGCVEGELERHHGARGVTDDVRPVDPEVAQQAEATRRVVGDCHGAGRMAAAGRSDHDRSGAAHLSREGPDVMNESVQTNHPTAPARSGGRPLERRRRLAAIVAALALLPVWAAFAYAGTEPSPVDPEWFVDETKLPFDPLAGPGGAAAQRSWGVLDGAGYRIEVPANWNGELVMWAHGFAGWGAELTVSNPPFRQWLVTNGYAWAASSYGKNGYVVSQGVEDTYQLAQWFTANVGTPTRVFMTGGSMGGHVTAVSLERHAGYYAGALPACGVLGDKELFDFFLDVSLGAQTVTGITTSYPFPDNWQSDVVRRSRPRSRPTRTRGPIRQPGQVPQRGRSAVLRRRLAKLDRLPLRAGPTKPCGPDPRRRQPRPGVPARRRSRRVR